MWPGRWPGAFTMRSDLSPKISRVCGRNPCACHDLLKSIALGLEVKPFFLGTCTVGSDSSIVRPSGKRSDSKNE